MTPSIINMILKLNRHILYMAFLPSKTVISNKTTSLADKEGDQTVEIIEKVFFEPRENPSTGKMVMHRVRQKIQKTVERVKIPRDPTPPRDRIGQFGAGGQKFHVPKARNRPDRRIKNSRWVRKATDAIPANRRGGNLADNQKNGTFASRMANQRRERENARREEEYKYTVFVDNIPDLDRDEIRELILNTTELERYNIKRINVVRDPHTREHRGKAFIVLDTIENADYVREKLNGTRCHSQIIYADKAEKRERK